MKRYIRNDGQECEALLFEGEVAGMDAGVFNVIIEMHKLGIEAEWRPTESTGVWDEDARGDIFEVFTPEMLSVSRDEWADDIFAGDYLVYRDGEYYVMGGSLFESMYEEGTHNV